MRRAFPGLYCKAVAVCIELFAAVTLEDVENVMYRTADEVVSIVLIVFDPDA